MGTIVISGTVVLVVLGFDNHIWWLAAAAFVGMVGYAIFHTFNVDRDHHIDAEVVTRTEDARTRQLAALEA